MLLCHLLGVGTNVNVLGAGTYELVWQPDSYSGDLNQTTGTNLTLGADSAE